eukprot:scaffold33368_cov32-Phaeocystis_antarctica.AAC.1
MEGARARGRGREERGGTGGVGPATLRAQACNPPHAHQVRLGGGGGDGGPAAALGGGRCMLGCSLAEAEAALLADSSPFLAEFKAAQGGSAISVGAWQ